LIVHHHSQAWNALASCTSPEATAAKSCLSELGGYKKRDKINVMHELAG
jgi:hypothetical protein